MANITLKEPVHVDIRIDGKNVELDLIAGDNEVPEIVAATLTAQGLVGEAPAKTSKTTTKSTSPVADETTTETSEN